MIRMKELLAITIMALSSTIIFAQEHHERDPQKRLHYLVQQLDLNDTQHEEIKKLFDQCKADMIDIRNSNLDREEKLAKCQSHKR